MGEQKKPVILKNHRSIWSFAFSIDHLHISDLIQKINLNKTGRHACDQQPVQSVSVFHHKSCEFEYR
jgi:hypothetical protein